MGKLFPPLASNCEKLIQQFDQITDERKSHLTRLSKYIETVYLAENTPKLIVICTHNSRRSHMGQLWLAAAADYFNLPPLQTYSGGTEGTAFYPSAVQTMRNIGFEIIGNNKLDNPQYLIQWRPDMKPYEAYSTRFDEYPNPKSDFGAIMVCTSADEACPFVPGAAFRVAIPFEDPKEFDGTDLEAEKYLERALDIGREILWTLSQIELPKTSIIDK